jgi:hypothetical protein
MHAELQEHAAFYLTGKRARAEGAGSTSQSKLRPALLAAYRDLSQLRYDFPVVLLAGDADEGYVESLTALIDQCLHDAAHDAALSNNDAQRLRIHALQLERSVRSLLATGTHGLLGKLIETSAQRLAAEPNAALADSMRRLQAALTARGAADAEVLDCDAALPARLIEHAWHVAQRNKEAAFRRHIDHLILKLGEILRADFAGGEAGRTPSQLRASVGGAFENAFDFDAMSQILRTVSSDNAQIEARRARIEATLAVLRSQRFYASAGSRAPFAFRFDNCAAALAAFRERVPALRELTRAIAAAELEIAGELSGPRLEALTRQLADAPLGARDLALFPDYLVCVNARALHDTQHGDLMQLLAGGLPMRLLVQDDDLLEEPLADADHIAWGARTPQLAHMAMALDDVYVVQAASSHLVRYRDRVLAAMRYSGPALISVYSGAGEGEGNASVLPPYLNAAAAMESRAFPAFTYDPSAGRDWTKRLALDGNPQIDRDWPVHALSYEDAELQRVAEDHAFTFVDFVACDRRYAQHFAPASLAENNGLAPVADCLDGETSGLPERLPRIAMVNNDNELQTMLVDARLMREARRCRDAWVNLRTLSGVGAQPATPAKPEASENGGAQPAATVALSAAPAAAPAAALAAAPSESATPDKERTSDDAYIETERCSTCNECITLNNKMFAYNANQQAYIVNLDAGTYRQLVEAAESCQVAVIHPGKPRNPNEPGLDELLKRAEPFL